MTELMREFGRAKSLSDPLIRDGIKARGPVDVVDDREGGKLGVFESDGVRFSERLPPEEGIDPVTGSLRVTVRPEPDKPKPIGTGGPDAPTARPATQEPRTDASPSQRARETIAGIDTPPAAEFDLEAFAREQFEDVKTQGEFVNAVSGGLTQGIAKAVVEGGRFLGVLSDEDVAQFDEAIAAFQPTDPAQRIVAKVAEVGGQFVVPGGAGFKLLLAAGASPLVAAMVADAGVFGVLDDPDAPDIANLIPEDSETFGALRDLLAVDPDDPDWVNRARKAGEAAVVVGIPIAIIEGVIAVIGRAKTAVKKFELTPIGQQFKAKVEAALIEGETQKQLTSPAKLLSPPDIKEVAGTSLPQPIFRSSADEIEAVLKEKSLSDNQKLMQAFGSKEAVKEFKRLDRARNNVSSPKRADAASAEFEAKFGDLNAEQDRLVYGIGETELQADELKSILSARRDIDVLDDEPILEIGRQITQGMRGTTPEALNRLISEGTAPASTQEAAIRISGGMDEARRRGLSSEEIDDLLLGAMENQGFSRPDAAEVLSGYLELGGVSGRTTTADVLGAAFALPIGGGIVADQVDADEIQVAGLGAILKAIRSGGKAATAATAQAEKLAPLAGRQGGVMRVRPATEQEASNFLSKIGIDGSKIPVEMDIANIATVEDLDRARQAMMDELKPQITAERRGVIKNVATLQMAEQLDILPRVLTRRIGEAFNAEEITATRMLLEQSRNELDELALRIRGSLANEREAFEFRRRMALHAVIQMQFLGARAEIGRALQAFKIDISGGTAATDARISELLNEFGGLKTAKQMAERWLKINDPAQRNKLAFRGAFVRTRDAFFEVWINGLLSGPMTHVRNVTGNTLFQMWSIPELTVSALIGEARSAVSVARGQGPIADRNFLGEVAARSYGVTQGLKDGWVAAAKAFRAGQPADPIGKIESLRHRAISAEAFNMVGPAGKMVDVIGSTVRIPGTFLMGMDEFYKGIAGRMEGYQIAYQRAVQARINGATEQEAADIAFETLRNPPPGVASDTLDAQRYYTFTDEPLGRINDLMMAWQRIPMVGRIVMPFRRTPFNLAKRFVERGPLAVAMPSVFKALKA
ncbi:hypothetical protein LCGC14_1431880, partial [marine sediment metagenome]